MAPHEMVARAIAARFFEVADRAKLGDMFGLSRRKSAGEGDFAGIQGLFCVRMDVRACV